MTTLSNNKSSRQLFFKNKLYHIPFWFIYHYLWWVVAIGNPLQAANSIFFSPHAVEFIFYVAFQAVAVYVNLYFLMPKYLEKSRFTAYILYLFITLILSSILIVAGYYVSAFLSGKPVEELYGPGSDCFSYFFGRALPSTVASMTLAMSIKLTKHWAQTRRRQQALEKEKIETELNFLKYQFNPHFLFNTINSIFFLIYKNPNMASASLAKFSDLLRYQLYECDDQQIQLSKEITYLENFVELEKLRQNANVEVTLTLKDQQRESLSIAPFILMTFVENAFKHVSRHSDQPNWIKIKLETIGQQLNFGVSNTTSQVEANDIISYGGIGLQNVQRRLDLVYAGLYNLTIQKDSTIFEVILKLDLSEFVQHKQLQKTA